MRRLSTPLPAWLSPKVHEYEPTVPSGSLEVEPSKDAVRSAAVQVNRAVGAWFGAGATVTSLVVEVVASSLSVTVSVIVYVPAVS